MKPIYLLLHVFVISFPLIRSFESKIRYAKNWYALFPAIFITAIVFLIWDVVFTRNGVWGFNEAYLIGWSLINLPLEEWLFFITVPFASVFIYECVRYFFPHASTRQWVGTFSLLFSLLLLLISIYNFHRSYTFWCFCFAGIFMALVSFQKPRWLGHFWIAYFFHLIPFLMVNGVLTGSFLAEPIVWYNNDHNLSLRLFTIPIEDTIYSMLLLLMNVTIFEYFRRNIPQTFSC